MFRKLHSNRDPQATLFSELRKEFLPYFQKAQHGLRGIAASYPRFLFAMMVINIVLSIVLVLTVCRRKGEPPKTPDGNPAATISGDFDRIRAAGAAMQQTIRLKREIDSLTQLPALSRADTLRLSSDLDSLRHIHLTLNP